MLPAKRTTKVSVTTLVTAVLLAPNSRAIAGITSRKIVKSKASSVQWAGPGLMKTSVEAHQTITSRLQPCFALKSRMSLRRASASSRLL